MTSRPLRTGIILCVIGLGGLILTQVVAGFMAGRSPAVRGAVLRPGVMAPRYPRGLGSL